MCRSPRAVSDPQSPLPPPQQRGGAVQPLRSLPVCVDECADTSAGTGSPVRCAGAGVGVGAGAGASAGVDSGRCSPNPWGIPALAVRRRYESWGSEIGAREEKGGIFADGSSSSAPSSSVGGGASDSDSGDHAGGPFELDDCGISNLDGGTNSGGDATTTLTKCAGSSSSIISAVGGGGGFLNSKLGLSSKSGSEGSENNTPTVGLGAPSIAIGLKSGSASGGSVDSGIKNRVVLAVPVAERKGKSRVTDGSGAKCTR